jgi:dCMP deaminase
MRDVWKWDLRYLDLAKNVSEWSKDPSSKVGAVIVNQNNQVVSVGYNGFPKGVKDEPERYNDRETKLKFVCHAERNAMDNAPVDLTGCTIYSTFFPCNECCKSIITRGIKHIVTNVVERNSPKIKDFNMEITRQMCREAGVTIFEHVAPQQS